MKKTLGGDRLGTGQKEQVELHGYGRSTHNMSYLFKTSASMGTIIPWAAEVLLPLDEVDIDLDIRILTGPTVGPEFASAKVQADVFTADVRLYNRRLHNNRTGMGLKMDTVKLPIVELWPEYLTQTELGDFTGSPDNISMNPSCILPYLGIRGVGIQAETDPPSVRVKRAFNAVPWIAYWDIYKNYYANKQEKEGALIHRPAQSIPTNITGVTVETIPPGGDIVVPNFPTTAADANLRKGTIITITTSALQPANTIWFNVSVTPFQLAANEIGEIISQTATELIISYNWIKYGDRQIINWYYADSRTMPAGKIQVQRFPLEDIDEMREAILGANPNVPFKVNDSAGAPDTPLMPWSFLLEGDGQDPDVYRPRMSSQEGLGLKTYLSDLFNNWLDTEWLDGPGGLNELTAVSVDPTTNSFTIDQLNMAEKLYDVYNRVVIAGNSYDDYMDAAYDDHRWTRPEIPIYHGGLIKELIFEEVVSQTESPADNQGTQPLGTLGGRGKLGNKHKGGTIHVKANEISYLMGMIHVTPRLDYSQGNQWHIHLKTIADYRIPGLDEIGFQELITEQMAWWDTHYDATLGKWIQKSAGKQPAWQNYRTNVNRVFGNFAIENNQMFMVMARRYQSETQDYGFRIDDLTTYIDPEKFNWIFAQTSLDSQNLWIQMSVNIRKRMLGSTRVIPNL